MRFIKCTAMLNAYIRHILLNLSHSFCQPPSFHVSISSLDVEVWGSCLSLPVFANALDALCCLFYTKKACITREFAFLIYRAAARGNLSRGANFV
jgi:hypothetical protein